MRSQNCVIGGGHIRGTTVLINMLKELHAHSVFFSLCSDKQTELEWPTGDVKDDDDDEKVSWAGKDRLSSRSHLVRLSGYSKVRGKSRR